MADSISLLNVIKQGGFDASLITSFNASLPFYEEVVLRRLVAAGCQQNIVLMDHAQCSLSWQSEATRPRFAGTAYSLVPVSVPGAFHPKVCILAGKKKAAILVGSHNLTLSGFGYNREITNWVHVTDRKDREGTALLDSVWQMVREWIELAREHVPPSLIEAVLSFSKSVAPLSAPGAATTIVALHQCPGGASLIEQIGARVKGEVRRIGVTGAFFDRDLALWRQAKRRATRTVMLRRQGLKEDRAWQSTRNGRGPWWNAGASHMNAAFPKGYFEAMGLISLLDTQRRLQSRS